MKQSKTKSAIVLVILLALLALFGYTAAFGWGETKSGSGEDIKLGLDLEGGVSITYQVVGEEDPSAADMSDTIYKLQKRVEGYSTEAQVYQEGSDRISIEIPGVADANEILSELGRPGSLEFYDVNGELVLEGTDVVDAQAGSSQNDMGNVDYEVRLTLTDEGAEKFSEATKAAAPNHDPIFIVYDNAIISYPAVQQQITDGNCVITNMESFEAAENLASTIRIGGLTLTLEELRSNVVDPDGADRRSGGFCHHRGIYDCGLFPAGLSSCAGTRYIRGTGGDPAGIVRHYINPAGYRGYYSGYRYGGGCQRDHLCKDP